MKKYILYIAAIILGTACNQMDDVYDEIDRDPYTKSLAITLGEDDYALVSKAVLANAITAEDSTIAESVAEDNAFNDSITAEDYVPFIMAQNYPALENGSNASVTYNTTVKPAGLSKYEHATVVKLSTGDYASVGGIVEENNTFFPSYPADEYLPTILASQFADAVEGDVAAVNYSYAEEAPSGNSEEITYTTTFDFEADINGFTIEQVSGTTGWEHDSYGYAKVGTYGKGINDTWLISPAMDFSADGSVLLFDVASYVSDKTIAEAGSEQFEVYYSTSHDGAVFDSSQWIRVTSVDDITLGDQWAFTSVRIELSELNTEATYIAFRHKSSETNGTTWEVDNVAAATIKAGDVLSTKKLNDMYAFDGTAWSIAEGVDMLDAEDYDAMGAPGKYDNFSSSDKPSYYIPTYLDLNYSYQEVGTEITVVYAYYGASTDLGADIYTFDGSVWSSASDINMIEQTSPFFYDVNGWVFDPAVRFTMEATDYQMVVDYVESTFGEIYVDRGNSEYYYGNSAYYSNLDARISKRTEFNVPLTDAEMAQHGVETWGDNSELSTEIIFNRVKFESIIALLEAKYPNSPVSVSGVEQTYEVTFKTYENDASSNYYTYQYKCTQAGPGAQFEFVEDITE